MNYIEIHHHLTPIFTRIGDPLSHIKKDAGILVHVVSSEAYKTLEDVCLAVSGSLSMTLHTRLAYLFLSDIPAPGQ